VWRRLKLILFVGDAPSSKMKPGAAPFEGAACEARLKEWITELVGHFEFFLAYHIVNRIDEDFASSVELAKERNFPIIALGNNASKALGKTPHFKLPHPSGRNRQINDTLFIKMKLSEAKDWLKTKIILKF
jgi:uracil-DNA glycosylase